MVSSIACPTTSGFVLTNVFLTHSSVDNMLFDVVYKLAAHPPTDAVHADAGIIMSIIFRIECLALDP